MSEDEFETDNFNNSQKKILLTIPKHNNTRYIYPLTQFIPKVTIEDYRSKRDLMYLLTTSLNENNYPEDYTLDESDNKIVVSFDNEDDAMCFAKKLNLEKMKNISYKDTKVTLTLVPNENYVQQKPIKKKGLPLDSIERLFRGETLFNKSNDNNSKKFKKIRKVYVSRDSPNYQNDVVGKILFFILFFFI